MLQSGENASTDAWAMGTGAAPGTVLGAWRGGGNFDRAFVYQSTETEPVEVTVPLHITDPNFHQNPEHLAVADGCVFMVSQSIFNTGTNVRHVSRVFPSFLNLTGTAAVQGVTRVKTSGCQAVWNRNDTPQTEDAPDPALTGVAFWDGATLQIIDAPFLDVRDLDIAGGIIVWARPDAGGIVQVFMYDSTAPEPALVQLTFDTEPGKKNVFPRTDGRHVAWVRSNTDGTDPHVMLLGGVQVSTADTRLADNPTTDHPVQLHRGQLLWTDRTGTLRYAAEGRVAAIEIAPAADVLSPPWLADGFVTWAGTSTDGGTDREVFLVSGVPPADPGLPAPPMAVTGTAGAGQITLAWATVLRATAYNVYIAQECPVTPQTVASLAGGRSFLNVTSPFTVTDLVPPATYCFAVTAVESGVEGPPAHLRTTLLGALAWTPVGGLGAFVFRALAADPGSDVVYAGGNGNGLNCGDADKVAGCDVFTSDGGTTWAPVTGAVVRMDARALAVRGGTVLAATRDFFLGLPSRILRSADVGASWTEVVPDGGEIGESTKAFAVDPLTPTTVYASNFELPGMTATDSFVLRSLDGGVTWTHRPHFPDHEIRGRAIVVDPVTAGRIYVGGSGTPNLARSDDGGATWQDVGLGPSQFVNTLAIHPTAAGTLWAGTTSGGIFKTTTAGAAWGPRNAGLPDPLPIVRALLVDPANPDHLHAATSEGYFFSLDAGETWTEASAGLATTQMFALAMTASRKLIAGTNAGLFLLNLTSPSADLSITKTGAPDPVTVGQPLTYTLTVGNAGPASVPGVSVVDVLPPTVAFGSATPSQGSCGGTATVTCGLGTLAGGASATVTIVVTPTAGATLTNTAGVLSNVRDPVPANNTATDTTTAVAPQFALTVNRAGTGEGVVTSSPPGIDCGADCEQPYDSGTQVTLSASPAPGSSFSGWSGACSGTGACIVAMTQARAVTASFTLQTFLLTVARQGSGTVTSSPAGIDCGGDCSQAYPAGTSVTLAAVGSAGSAFVGWSGACTGVGPCVLSMTAARSVTAAFQATAFSFADEPLVLRATPVKALHFLELQAAIDALRAAHTLGSFPWTPLQPGVTIRTLHVTEARAALDAAYQAAGQVLPVYTDAVLAAGQTPVKALHVEELRAAVRRLE